MTEGGFAEESRQRVEIQLRRALEDSALPEGPLLEAMAYGLLGGGKRLRPLLVYGAAHALGGRSDCADVAACAVEMLHAYSLIHDDLPAMDDDALRRGKPTCHIVYGEAIAILAGDALQALAFELLATSPQLEVPEALRLRMLALLARAAGAAGMVGGQSLDLNAAGTLLDEHSLARMHGLKTGALIRASVLLGALATGLASEEDLAALGRFADCVGLAFQVRDDVLDVTGDTGILGKQQGRDQLLSKPTYPALLGIEGAQRKAADLVDAALQALAAFGPEADPLRGLASYIVARTH